MIILLLIFLIRLRRLPISTRTDTLFPYSTLFLSARRSRPHARHGFHAGDQAHPAGSAEPAPDAAVLGHFRCPDQAARAAVHAQPGGNPGRSTQFGRRNRRSEERSVGQEWVIRVDTGGRGIIKKKLKNIESKL